MKRVLKYWKRIYKTEGVSIWCTFPCFLRIVLFTSSDNQDFEKIFDYFLFHQNERNESVYHKGQGFMNVIFINCIIFNDSFLSRVLKERKGIYRTWKIFGQKFPYLMAWAKNCWKSTFSCFYNANAHIKLSAMSIFITRV